MDCQAPYNYSEVLDYDYVENATTVIGTKVKYNCLDATKNMTKVDNLDDNDEGLFEYLEVECLYNGQWSPPVIDYGCTGNYFLYNPFRKCGQ